MDIFASQQQQQKRFSLNLNLILNLFALRFFYSTYSRLGKVSRLYTIYRGIRSVLSSNDIDIDEICCKCSNNLIAISLERIENAFAWIYLIII